MLRALAREALRRQSVDAAVRYRELLGTDQPPSVGALAGLGECGDAGDIPLLLRGLDHPVARARAAAVGSLRQLTTTPPPELRPLLADPSSRVRRQAAAALGVTT